MILNNNIDAFSRSDSYSALNDDADPLFTSGSDVHIIGDSRTIHSLIFSASILFGL